MIYTLREKNQLYLGRTLEISSQGDVHLHDPTRPPSFIQLVTSLPGMLAERGHCCRRGRRYTFLKNPIAHYRNSRRDWVCPLKTNPESNAKMLILLFYVLKRCFLGSFWVDRPSLSVSFRSGQFRLGFFGHPWTGGEGASTPPPSIS